MSDFERELKVFADFQQWMADALEIKAQFDRARLPVPVPLARVFGDGPQVNVSVSSGLSVPPIPEPNRPAGVGRDWVWVDIADTNTMSLVKAIMYRAGVPMRPKDIADQVSSIRPDLSTGGVYNTGKSLEAAGLMLRHDDGWLLKPDAVSPILNGKYLWAPADIMQKSELASHRRDVILHILGVFKSGLQILQIVEQLQRVEQCRAPVNKDLVKFDMEILQDQKKVKRAGSSKKWVLAQED